MLSLLTYSIMNRRHFTLALASIPFVVRSAGHRPKILLRSSWQTVNIGDIGHTPGVLHLLEKHIPEADVTLVPGKLDNGVEPMLRKRFPNVTFALTDAEKKKAYAESDFFLHGSGPSLVAEKDLAKWVKETGKPYGIYGITFSSQGSTSTKPTSSEKISQTVQLLSGAKFAFFRDSVSLELAKAKGCTCPIMEFGPDGAFAVDLANDEPAMAFLKEHGLEEKKFLCCIPRLRFSEYWKMKAGTKFDEVKHKRNEAMKEHDISPLRDAIIRVVKETDLKVLLCPEDSSQMDVAKVNIYDKLPAEVKDRVVWRDKYWLTDEAISTYRRSAGLFGLEMHSPIMCVGNGIPAIVCRFAEQTSKGFMWKDIGLGDWLFDVDKEDERARIPEAVLAMAKDHAAAVQKTAGAKAFVEKRQKETMGALRSALSLG